MEYGDSQHLSDGEVYENVLLGTVFWLPAALITTFYIYIFVQLRSFHVKDPPGEKSEGGVLIANGTKMDPSKTVSATALLRDSRTSSSRMSSLSVTSHSPKWRQELSSTNIFTQTGLLVIAYLVCWLPYFIVASSDLKSELKILSTMIALNSAVNPILYAFD